MERVERNEAWIGSEQKSKEESAEADGKGEAAYKTTGSVQNKLLTSSPVSWRSAGCGAKLIMCSAP
jgi:hypothetical protein